RFATPQARAANVRTLWDLIQPWYDAHAKHEVFHRALNLGLALGMVMTASDALSDAHLHARHFLAEHHSAEGTFTAPARPFIMPGVATHPGRVPSLLPATRGRATLPPRREPRA